MRRRDGTTFFAWPFVAHGQAPALAARSGIASRRSDRSLGETLRLGQEQIGATIELDDRHAGGDIEGFRALPIGSSRFFASPSERIVALAARLASSC